MMLSVTTVWINWDFMISYIHHTSINFYCDVIKSSLDHLWIILGSKYNNSVVFYYSAGFTLLAFSEIKSTFDRKGIQNCEVLTQDCH